MNSILFLISLFLVIVAFVRAVSKHRARKSSLPFRKKSPERAGRVSSGNTHIVVFAGTAEFKTNIPEGVLFLDELEEFLERVNFSRISASSLQRAVTRLEQNEETERNHIEFLEKTFGRR